MMKMPFRFTILLISSVLLFGCEGKEPLPTAVKEPLPAAESAAVNAEAESFSAHCLAGQYCGQTEENGEITLQLYYIDETLIAEAVTQYTAYYAAELIPAESEPVRNGETAEAEFTAYAFSGFSGEGAYWEQPYTVSFSLNSAELLCTEENGQTIRLTRTEDAEPLHDSGRYRDSVPQEETSAFAEMFAGKWEACTENSRMVWEVRTDGTVLLCSRNAGEPICVHIGLGWVDEESGILHTMTERVGWGTMPYFSTFAYTLTEDGRWILKNTETGGILPTEESVEFRNITEAGRNSG